MWTGLRNLLKVESAVFDNGWALMSEWWLRGGGWFAKMTPRFVT